jgi:hypothetical protein
MSEGKTFTCERCGGTFTSASSDGEAMAEARANGFTEPQEDIALICDDCYQAFMDWMSGIAKVPAPGANNALANILAEAGRIDWSDANVRVGAVEWTVNAPRLPWWRRLLSRIQRVL